MNNEHLAYDRRQLDSMAQQLSLFQRGGIDLAHLIKGLEALMNLLQTSDSCWKESLKSEWWTLEQVYAVALDRDKGQLGAADKDAVKEAVQNIESLVESERRRIADTA